MTWDDKDDDSCDAADDDNAVVLSCLSQMVEKGGLGQKVSQVKRQLVFRVNTSTYQHTVQNYLIHTKL